MAENYLQHAEHYNRIIAAAQAQMPIQQPKRRRDDLDDDMDEGATSSMAASNAGEPTADRADSRSSVTAG